MGRRVCWSWVIGVFVVAACDNLPGREFDPDNDPGTSNSVPAQPNLAFVTRGKVSVATGIAAADMLCQSEARAAGRSGTYRALLSTETVGAASRLVQARGWIRPDGKPFADRVEDFFGPDEDVARIYYPLRITADGADLGNVLVMTGTEFDGSPANGNTCESWTSENGQARFGYSASAGSRFSSSIRTGCVGQFPVYCFGVDAVAPLTVQPVAGRKAFVTEQGWLPGGGIADADALCQAEADAAGFSGSFKALLATIGASAASRFDASGATWVRPDGMPLKRTAAQMFHEQTTSWDVALNTTADLAYQHSGKEIWSGAPMPVGAVNPLTVAGTRESTCDNWTFSEPGAGMGSSGRSDDSSLLERFAHTHNGCSAFVRKVTCFEE